MVLSTSSADVSTLPTSTTNITGFLIIQRGFSLRKESISAWPTICEFQRLVFLAIEFVPLERLKELSGFEHQVFEDWSQAQRREEGERAQDQNHADEQHGE